MTGPTWADGAAYERFMGRWSRLVATEFVGWLDVPGGADWLDVGTGTGALVEAILRDADPRSVRGIDRSAGFVSRAMERVADTARLVRGRRCDGDPGPG